MKREKREKGNNSSRRILSSAVRDLEIEISKLSNEKDVLRRELKKVSSSMDVDRDVEKELQKKIAGLVEKEVKLNQKKKILEMKIEGVSDKISKITKIKSEMTEI